MYRFFPFNLFFLTFTLLLFSFCFDNSNSWTISSYVNLESYRSTWNSMVKMGFCQPDLPIKKITLLHGAVQVLSHLIHLITWLWTNLENREIFLELIVRKNFLEFSRRSTVNWTVQVSSTIRCLSRDLFSNVAQTQKRWHNLSVKIDRNRFTLVSTERNCWSP